MNLLFCTHGGGFDEGCVTTGCVWPGGDLECDQGVGVWPGEVCEQGMWPKGWWQNPGQRTTPLPQDRYRQYRNKINTPVSTNPTGMHSCLGTIHLLLLMHHYSLYWKSSETHSSFILQLLNYGGLFVNSCRLSMNKVHKILLEKIM